MPSRGNNNSTEPSSEGTVQEKNHKLGLPPLALVGLLALTAAFSLPAAKIIALGWEKVKITATPWFSWIATFWGQGILLLLYLIAVVLFLYLLFEIVRGIVCACGSIRFFKWLRNKDQGSITPTLFKSVLVFATLGVGGGIVTYNVSDNGPAWVELIAGAFTATGAMFAALLLFHRGEEDRRSRESTAREELRTRRREGFGERMSTAIDHLISTNIGARAAGMVELAALADDWHALAEEAKQDATSEKEKERLTDESRRRQQELVDLIFKQPLPALKPEATDVEIKSLQRTRSLIISNHCNGEENNWSFINFERAELSHAELSGKDLSGWNLGGAKLNFAVLRSVKLHNAKLQEAQLNNAELDYARLNNASLIHAQLNNANLRRTELNNADVYMTQLNNADVYGTQLNNANLRWTELNNANLSDARLNNADLMESELNNAEIREAEFINANLSDARLNNADLRRAELNNANLGNTKLNNANLGNAKLNNANLGNAKLNNADLGNAKLNNANLRRAELNNANLGNAKLNNANLKKAELNNANLKKAELNNANLKEAELNNADLSRAQLKNADLRDVHLKEASFSETIYSSGTSFPDGFDPNDTD